MQAGAREYPGRRFPEQHLKKPGLEADLQLAPMYDAPYYKGSDKLKDKVALITGGDSGIGRAVAVLFAREGADVAIAYLDEHEDAEETKRAVEKEGRRCILIAGDVADPEFCTRGGAGRRCDELGRLDMLVNNAAFQEHVDDFEDLSDEHFDRTLKTNLYGYFYMAQAAVPHMKPGGAIVMTGSVTGIAGSKDLLDYSMTKGGIHAFTRSLAAHLVPQGHPGERRGARPGVDAAQSGRQARPRRSRSSARNDADEARRPSRRRSRRPSCSSPRRAAPATSPARSCRSSAAIRAEGLHHANQGPA